jgi:hypothetical protein
MSYRGNTTTPTTRKFQKRFLNWLGGFGRWNIERAGSGTMHGKILTLSTIF